MSARDLPELVLAQQFLTRLRMKYGDAVLKAPGFINTLPEDELDCIAWAIARVNEAKN